MTLSPVIVWLARGLALAGGLVLVAITLITVVSITGRSLNTFGMGPVPGDFELVEAGTGFAVFAFLPWCQLMRGHAAVDLFTGLFPSVVNRVIDLVSEALMTFVIVIIAWRLWAGTIDKLNYGETTFILQFPVWWAYAASLVAAIGAVIVSFYMLFVRFREVASGQTIVEPGQGGMH
ncbi:MAG: TRAP transporter small permease [Rhizobiaceae bacterium]|nr:TRAP transporter small permease [Rhizobiaceae bacterium]MCV0407878.1 TRAP transporter small permease [Rhizobiaceae bacterium]